MKKTIVFILMAMCLAGVLSGCSSGSVSEQMVIQQSEYYSTEPLDFDFPGAYSNYLGIAPTNVQIGPDIEPGYWHDEYDPNMPAPKPAVIYDVVVVIPEDEFNPAVAYDRMVSEAERMFLELRDMAESKGFEIRSEGYGSSGPDRYSFDIEIGEIGGPSNRSLSYKIKGEVSNDERAYMVGYFKLDPKHPEGDTSWDWWNIHCPDGLIGIEQELDVFTGH